jgi:uncharacterized membrane protein YgdD (TMEM256/DUF423 family)
MNTWLVVAAVNGFIAVAAGAFGAHGLQGRLDPHSMEIFSKAAQYQMVHALAMGLAAIAGRRSHSSAAGLASLFFLVGIILFSGSLYALALTGEHTIGFVTPFGGLSFLLGWAALAWAAAKGTS